MSETAPAAIAVIGVGRVGAPLADHLQRAGHRVSVAASDPGAASVRALLARNPELIAATSRDAVAAAEVVVLATPFAANAQVLADLGDALDGKVLIDATNPVGPGLTHPLRARSGAQVVQEAAPGARVIKAFSIYGFENLEDNAYPAADVAPAMLFCGDDADAKEVVGGLIRQLGWEPVDVGGIAQALHLEHMTLLWVRMVRADGGSPGRVWAILRR